jgi:hypothetical protein
MIIMPVTADRNMYRNGLPQSPDRSGRAARHIMRQLRDGLSYLVAGNRQRCLRSTMKG